MKEYPHIEEIKVSGKAYGFITMPGILVHELAHYFACIATRTEVLQFSYNDFSSGKDYLGYVVHRPPKNYFAELLIPSAPLLLNSLVASLVMVPLWSSFDSFRFSAWQYPLLYLSLAIAVHGIPSEKDNENLAKASWDALNKFNPFALIGLGLALGIGAANAIRAVGRFHFGFLVLLDFFYAFSVVCGGVAVGQAMTGIPIVRYTLLALAGAVAVISWVKRDELKIFAASLAGEAALYLLLSSAVSILVPMWIWLVLQVGVIVGMIIIVAVVAALALLVKAIGWAISLFRKSPSAASSPKYLKPIKLPGKTDFFIGPDGSASKELR